LSDVAEDLIVVARVARTRGLRGEVVADLLTDFPERFTGLTSLIGLHEDGARRSLQIEEHWFHGNRIVFKFAGFDGVDEAKELVGYALALPAGERIELPQDSFYDWELAGCRVETIGGEPVGEVRNVMRTGGVELLAIVDDAGRERLIPMVSDVCIEIDVKKKLIRIDPPQGLLEL
jgi:16S rRNA processing protein RimM